MSDESQEELEALEIAKFIFCLRLNAKALNSLAIRIESLHGSINPSSVYECLVHIQASLKILIGPLKNLNY